MTHSYRATGGIRIAEFDGAWLWHESGHLFDFDQIVVVLHKKLSSVK